MPPSKPTPSFFKRELPSLCTEFSSPKGRHLFTTALAEGYMENYFRISQYLTTQSDPTFCGLATLTMALNALGIDPLRHWKGRQGPWRFWSDDMLDCCRTLDDVRKQGITLDEFKCLASCNGLAAQLTGGANGLPQDRQQGIQQFEDAVKKACATDDQVLAVSFSRKLLSQTGTGHFSCIGGYCEKERQILLLETAMFKYPCYWVSIDQLYDAMIPPDPSTSQPRGYVVLSELHLPIPSSSMTSSNLLSLNFHKNSWANLVQIIRSHFADTASPTLQNIIVAIHKATPTPLLTRVLCEKSPQDAPDHYAHQLEHVLEEAQSLAPEENPKAIIFALAFAASKPKLLNPSAPSQQPHLKAWAQDALEQMQDSALQNEVQQLARLMANLDKCCQREAQACAGCSCEVRHGS